MNEKWKEQMRAKMEDYTEHPPRMNWAEIERDVARRRAAGRRRAMAIVWSRRAAAVAVAVVIVTASVRLAMPGDRTQTTAQQTATPARPAATATTATTPAATPAQLATLAPGGNTTATTRAAATTTTPAPQLMAQADTPTPSTTPTPPTPPTTPTTTTPPTTTPKSSTLPAAGDNLPLPERKRRPRLALGAYLANAPSSQTDIGSPVMMLASANPIGTYDMSMSSEAVNNALRLSTESETSVRHSTPVRVGLSLRYSLGQRWSIETGLTYTYLHSEITHRRDDATRTEDQRLHYVGIPVALSYSLWTTGRLSVYASANAMAEKCVGGTHTVSRPQFSAGAALGAELSLGAGFAVYAQPGVTYRFDNHSTTPTIYKDRPTDFNLDIGVRFNLK